MNYESTLSTKVGVTYVRRQTDLSTYWRPRKLDTTNAFRRNTGPRSRNVGCRQFPWCNCTTAFVSCWSSLFLVAREQTRRGLERQARLSYGRQYHASMGQEAARGVHSSALSGMVMTDTVRSGQTSGTSRSSLGEVSERLPWNS